MIKLINVSKYFVTPVGRHYIFREVSIELPLDKNVGVIGPNGAGKSTFLRLLAGADHPSSGVIKKSGSISPPMGLTPVLQRSLSALENVRFAGRIYGMKKPEIDQMVAYVRELSGIGHFFEMPVETYSAGMRQKVAFGINMSMHFDYYLFDEISAGGDREFKKMARAKVAERLRTSRFLMTSHDTRELLELCDAGIVIKDGKLNYFDDIRDAAVFYGDDVDAGSKKKSKWLRLASTVEAADKPLSTEDAKDEARKLRRSKRIDRRRLAKSEPDLPKTELALPQDPPDDRAVTGRKPARSNKGRDGLPAKRKAKAASRQRVRRGELPSPEQRDPPPARREKRRVRASLAGLPDNGSRGT